MGRAISDDVIYASCLLILASLALEPAALASSDRIQNERPSAVTRNLRYGPLLPLRWVGLGIGKGLNWTLYNLEEKGIVPRSAIQAPEPKEKREPTIKPLFGGLGDGSGLGGGVRFSSTVWDTRFTASARISTRLYQHYLIEMKKEFGGFATGPQAWFGYRPQEDFFGHGANSALTDRSNFKFQQRALGWSSTAKIGRGIELRHLIYGSRIATGSGTDDRFPTTPEVFPESLIDGRLGADYWLSNQFAALIEGRDDPDDPRSGAALDASVSFHTGLRSTPGDFTTLRLVGYAYIPLSDLRRHVLALRAEATDNISGEEIPFYAQPALGGSTTLRGFLTQRFRDNDSLAATAEYRYKVWTYLDAVIFGDAGQVYSDVWSDIDDHSFHTSAGGGARFASPFGDFRVLVGRSNEDTRVYFKLGRSW